MIPTWDNFIVMCQVFPCYYTYLWQSVQLSGDVRVTFRLDNRRYWLQQCTWGQNGASISWHYRLVWSVSFCMFVYHCTVDRHQYLSCYLTQDDWGKFVSNREREITENAYYKPRSELTHFNYMHTISNYWESYKMVSLPLPGQSIPSLG